MNADAIASSAFGKKVKCLRKKKSMTQAQVAKLSGVVQAEVSRVETNPGSVRILTIEKVVAALGYTLERFLKEKHVVLDAEAASKFKPSELADLIESDVVILQG